jgi:DNA processing protein
MRTSRGVFPSRNRIVAGLSSAIIITEGAEKSGSLITASFGADYGRDVYAVPGPVTSPQSFATNHLLKTGAKIALDPEDVLADMNIVPTKTVPITVELTDEERKIVELFVEHSPLHIDEISRNLNTDVSSLSVQLSLLAMKGILQEMDGGEYTIKT